MLKMISTSWQMQSIFFLRVKEALFYTIIFPVFLFIMFSLIWGGVYENYVFNLLTGVVIMTAASDGIFGIGLVVKRYYSSGLIKILNLNRANILPHVLGIALSHFMVLSIVILLVSSACAVFFGTTLSWEELARIEVSALLGLIIFSLVGLVINFSSMKDSEQKSLGNIAFFLILFTSDAFYPVSDTNETLAMLSSLFPFNDLLDISRGNLVHWWKLILWIIVPAFLFVFIFRKFRVKR